jgi:hypothetical protein
MWDEILPGTPKLQQVHQRRFPRKTPRLLLGDRRN